MGPTLPMDAGEGRRIAVEDGAHLSTPPYDNFAGCIVTMRLRNRVTGAVIDPVPGDLDPPDSGGKVRGAGAYVPKSLPFGVYDGELEVDLPGGGADWPQRWPFELQVRRRAAVA